MVGGCVVVVAGLLIAARQLPELVQPLSPPTQSLPPSGQLTEADQPTEPTEDAILKMHLAERERMDREEEERERRRREEDERWAQAEAERRQREAEEARHQELLDEKRRQAALLERQHQERMEQEEAIARAQARADRQRQADAERRHRESLAQMKKTEDAARRSPGIIRSQGPSPGIVPNKTERMMKGGAGLFERD
jgi:hypothetical protein